MNSPGHSSQGITFGTRAQHLQDHHRYLVAVQHERTRPGSAPAGQLDAWRLGDLREACGGLVEPPIS
jgi:hypothetical protein